MRKFVNTKFCARCDFRKVISPLALHRPKNFDENFPKVFNCMFLLNFAWGIENTKSQVRSPTKYFCFYKTFRKKRCVKDLVLKLTKNSTNCFLLNVLYASLLLALFGTISCGMDRKNDLVLNLIRQWPVRHLDIVVRVFFRVSPLVVSKQEVFFNYFLGGVLAVCWCWLLVVRWCWAALIADRILMIGNLFFAPWIKGSSKRSFFLMELGVVRVLKFSHSQINSRLVWFGCQTFRKINAMPLPWDTASKFRT